LVDSDDKSIGDKLLPQPQVDVNRNEFEIENKMMPSIVAFKPKNASVSMNEDYLRREGSLKIGSRIDISLNINRSDPSDKSEER